VVSSIETIQRVATHALQMEIPTAAAAASSPDPSVGKEGLQADLDTVVGVNASSLDPKAVRILSEAVATTWEVDWLHEILAIASRVHDYYEKPVTQ
jgi:hypothetical protein